MDSSCDSHKPLVWKRAKTTYLHVQYPPPAQEERAFSRFFWREDGNLDTNPVEWEMCVHMFGAVSSADDFEKDYCMDLKLHPLYAGTFTLMTGLN